MEVYAEAEVLDALGSGCFRTARHDGGISPKTSHDIKARYHEIR
jgi:hypothetical protein